MSEKEDNQYKSSDFQPKIPEGFFENIGDKIAPDHTTGGDFVARYERDKQKKQIENASDPEYHRQQLSAEVKTSEIIANIQKNANNTGRGR
jgi:hypothetical protein